MDDGHWTSMSVQAESHGAIATLNTPAFLINLIFLASHEAMWC